MGVPSRLKRGFRVEQKPGTRQHSLSSENSSLIMRSFALGRRHVMYGRLPEVVHLLEIFLFRQRVRLLVLLKQENSL